MVKKLAEEQGQTPELFYEQNAATVDPYLDSWQQKSGEEQEEFILDSRLGFYFVPQSFRVFLSCDAEIAAQRAHSGRKANPNYATLEQTIQTIREKEAFEKKNYTIKYGIPNFHLPFHYDLHIDTTAKTPDAIALQILKEYQKYEQVTGEI
jgi:cytidylate kinase